MEYRQIVQIGKHAKDQFEKCQGGSVLAVFSNIIYLQNFNEEISWINSSQFPMHRRCIQIDGHLPKLEVGSIYIVENQCLMFKPLFELDYCESYNWQSPNIEITEDRARLIDHNKIQKSLQLFSRLEYPKGLGVYFSKILSKYSNTNSVPIKYSSKSTELIYWSLINNVISLDLDSNKFVDEAIKIIGLGAGLTPSGDDFFGGLFFTLNYLNIYYSLNFDLDLHGYLEQIRKMTNPISYAIMADMVQGHGLDSLHNLLDSVLRGTGDAEIKGYCNDLLKVGNSTGWDILTGMSVGLLNFNQLKLKQSQETEFEDIYI